MISPRPGHLNWSSCLWYRQNRKVVEQQGSYERYSYKIKYILPCILTQFYNRVTRDSADTTMVSLLKTYHGKSTL